MSLTLLLSLAPVAASRAGGLSTVTVPGAGAVASPVAVPVVDAPAGTGYVLPLPGVGPISGGVRELVERGVVLRAFVAPGSPWGAGHRGVDLAAPAASAVLAPGAGTVTFVGVVVDRPLLVITHPDGLRSTLEPVVSGRAAGSRVETGAAVGVLAPEASTHCAPLHCLHWGVRRGEEYLDPLVLLGVAEAVVLLPR